MRILHPVTIEPGSTRFRQRNVPRPSVLAIAVGVTVLASVALPTVATSGLPFVGGARAGSVGEGSQPIQAGVDRSAQLAAIDRQISSLRAARAAASTSSGSQLLASLLLDRARTEGDASALDEAASIAEQELARTPSNPDVMVLAARAVYGQHRFADAARLADRAIALRPNQADALAVRFDAAVELGDISTARAVLRKLVAAAPSSPAVLVRRSRFAFLQGDAMSARSFAERARVAAPRSGAVGGVLAFYDTYLGQVFFDQGDLERAGTAYKRALASSPGDLPATIGLARVFVAQTKFDQAITLLQPVLERVPDPDGYALLGDAYALAGNITRAEQSYEVVTATAQLAGTTTIYHRELALFYADHRVNEGDALRLARAEREVRSDVYSDDTVAWTAFRSGDLDTAWTAAKSALSFGVRDAAIYGHAGLIAAARGDDSKALELLRQSIAINKNFHPLVAQEVRDQLRTLENLKPDSRF
jgi:tetratricopeptide (TPR) repeat protein